MIGLLDTNSFDVMEENFSARLGLNFYFSDV